MKRTSVTRRLLAGAAGVLVGGVGAVALASPASAHHPIVNGVGECDTETGEYVITWTVSNSEHDIPGVITSVDATPEGVALSTIVVDAELPKSGEGELTEQVRVPGDTTSASLTVEASWTRGSQTHDKTRSDEIGLNGDCEEQTDEDGSPLANYATIASCDFFVFIVENSAEQGDVEFSLTPDQDSTHGHAPSFIPLLDEDGDVVEIPDDAELVDAEAVNAGETVGPLGPFEPGEAHAHGFQAAAGLTVTLEITHLGETVVSEEISWDDSADGLDCEGGQGGEEEEELPVTGAPTLLIAGGAVLLLALGGGLFLLARRRRVSFTA